MTGRGKQQALLDTQSGTAFHYSNGS